MKSKYINIVLFTCLLIQGTLWTSCKKFVDVNDPNDQLNSNKVFSDSSNAVSAITAIYSEMIASRNQFSSSSVTLYAGLSGDDLYNYSPGLNAEFTKNQITQVNHLNIDNSVWKPAYKHIYSANLAIEKIMESQVLSVSLKNQLIGEAKFIRAFCYSNLVNLFGDVPLIMSSNYRDNASLPRTAAAEVYAQAIKDLADAKNLLSVVYVTSERIRPNKWTASALLSRCYLYTSQWQNAANEANAIITSGTYALENNLNNVFLKGSAEAIWQLKPVSPTLNTYEGLEILPASSSSIPTYLITPSLLNSFEANDNRKTSWINSRIFNNTTLFFPFKYKIRTGTLLNEYYMVFRLAEQYLIRAEAAVNLNNLSDARSSINSIRVRAGLGNTVANDVSSLKLAIENERRSELFSEWGHRWFDLKRTGRANAVLAPLKGATWQATDVLWPLPQQELNLNPFLIQNPGY